MFVEYAKDSRQINKQLVHVLISGSYIKEEKKDIETFMIYSRPPEVFTVFSFN